MPKLGSSTVSGASAHSQKARKKQIEKLRQQKLSVTSLHGDTQYKVEFIVKYDNTITRYSIVIDLPPAFPNEPPVLFVQPPCSHKYLDAAQMVVNFPPLENFKKKQDLSSVVKHLVAEFEKSPPIPLVLNEFEQQQQEEILRIYTPTRPEEMPTIHIANDNCSIPEQSYSGPRLPDILPEIEDLSLEELKELDSDEMQLLALFHGTELAKGISEKREEISKRIESIANENLSKSGELESLKTELVQKHEMCRSLKDEYDKNLLKFNEATEWMSLPNLSLTMQVAAADQEQKSEQIVESFLEGNTDVAEFTKEFLKTKTLATIRKAKEDKIGHILSST